MLNTRHPLYVVSKYGYVLKHTPSLDSLITRECSIWPDFILIKREDTPVLQGMATVLGIEVVYVELLDTSNPSEPRNLNTSVLLSHPYPKHRLHTLIRRIPSPKYDRTSKDKLYLISVE